MIAYFFIKLFAGFIALLPFTVIYLLSDVLSFLLEKIIRYRSRIIDQNLAFAFENKTETERKKIKKQFYKHLSDLILESFVLLGKPAKKIIPRLQFTNPEILDTHLAQNQNIIALGGHIANWEYPNVAIPSQTAYQMAALVKPLNNAFLDRYINKRRSISGATMISTYHSHRTILDESGPAKGFVFIADQYPPNQKRAVKAQLFGKETLFLHGAQQIAIKKNYPVYGIRLSRIKRGYYTMTLDLLDENPTNSTEAKLTQDYASYLEKQILEKPSHWLWSHKRWKTKIEYV